MIIRISIILRSWPYQKDTPKVLEILDQAFEKIKSVSQRLSTRRVAWHMCGLVRVVMRWGELYAG